MNSTNRKPVVGTQRFAVAALKKDSKDSITYGEVVEWDKSLISAGHTPNNVSGSLEASDQTIDQYVIKMGGSLEVAVPGLESDDEVLLFGDKKDETTGVITTAENDIVPDVMVMYSTKRSDGTINLYKFHKVKFNPAPENGQSKTTSGQTYSTITLSGNYVNTIFNGVALSRIKGLDVSKPEGKAKYDAWFESATGGLPVSTGA